MEEKGPEARTVKTDETVETDTTVKSNRDKWRRQAAQPAATATQSQPHEPGYYCGHAETDRDRLVTTDFKIGNQSQGENPTHRRNDAKISAQWPARRSRPRPCLCPCPRPCLCLGFRNSPSKRLRRNETDSRNEDAKKSYPKMGPAKGPKRDQIRTSPGGAKYPNSAAVRICSLFN